MDNIEKNNQENQELTIEKLEELMFGDYPQHSALYVLANLDMVADGDWDEDTFYQKTNIELIKNIDEYIENYCTKHNLEPPKELSEKINLLAKTIDTLVTELKQSVNNQDDLKKIYSIVKRFESEADIKMQSIPFFEK